MSIVSVLEAIARLAASRPRVTLLGSFLLTMGLSLCALGLRFDPNPSSMLPPGSPALKGLNTLVEVFGAGDQLFLAVETPTDSPQDQQRARAAIEAIASEVLQWTWYNPQVNQKEPLVGLVIGRLDEEARQARQNLVGRAGFLALSDAGLEQFEKRLQPRYLKTRLERGPSAAVPAALRQRDVLGLWSTVYAEDIGNRMGDDLPLRQDQGYLVSKDGTIHVLMLKPRRPIKDMPFTHAITDALNAVQDEFNRQHPDLTMYIAGGYPLASRDFKAAQSSAVVMAATSFLGIMLLFGLVYRSLRLIGFIGAVVLPSVGAGLGMATLLLGSELSLVMTAFSAILVGLGVDYIIHLYNAYAWALHHDTVTHSSPADRRGWAAVQAVHRVGPGIALGCLTTATSFAILSFGEFRGMQELGVVSALALSMMLLLVLLIIPALLTLWGPDEYREPKVVRYYTRWFATHTQWFVAGSIALVLVVIGILATREQLFVFDHDLRKLRPHESVHDRDYEELGKRLGISFGGLELLWTSQDPTALLDAAWQFTTSLDHLREPLPCTLQQDLSREELVAGLDHLAVDCTASEQDLIGRHVIDTPWGEASFSELRDGALQRVELVRHWDVPAEPALLPAGHPMPLSPLLHRTGAQLSLLPSPSRQQAVLARLADSVDWAKVEQVLDQATPKQRERYHPFFSDLQAMHQRVEAAEPLLPYDLLDGPLAELIRATCVLGEDGTVYLRMPLALRPDHTLVPFEELYTALGFDPALKGHHRPVPGVDVTVVGGVALSYELQTTIVDNFLRLSIYAAIATVLILVVCMRHVGNMALVLGTLGFGIAVMLAGLHLIGQPWNIINIAVFPLIIGIGIDNGIHFIHHLSRQTRCSNGLSRTLIEIGHPILMTTLTSVVGFGSLLLNAYIGIQGLGLAACIGLVACMASTLLLLPALLICTHYKPPSDSEQDPLSRVMPAVGRD